MNFPTLLKILNFYARFTPNYTKIGYFARRLTWGSSPPLDFSGQRWVITGANAGLGNAMLRAAGTAGAEVVAVARNAEKLDAAIAELPATCAERVTPVIADMSLQSETRVLLDKLVADATSIRNACRYCSRIANRPICNAISTSSRSQWTARPAGLI